MSSEPTFAELVIQQGRTFRKIVRWEAARFTAVAIAAMSQAGIIQITTQSVHGLPDGWRVAVVDARGMTDLNAQNNPPKASDFYEATVVSTSAVELNSVSSAAFPAYTSGGFLKWHTPHELAGYTARMSIKDRVGGTVLLTLTTENGGLTVDDSEKLIELFISDADTTAITWSNAVFDLEMVAPGGDVTAILTGTVSVTPEVTT